MAGGQCFIVITFKWGSSRRCAGRPELANRSTPLRQRSPTRLAGVVVAAAVGIRVVAAACGMRGRCALLLLAVWTAGCRDDHGPRRVVTSAPATAASLTGTATASEALAVNVAAVVAVGKMSFREGTIRAIAGGEVTYAWGDPDDADAAPREATTVRGRVWAVGHGLVGSVAPGDSLLCRTSPQRWVACNVLAVDGAIAELQDDVGGKHRLGGVDMLRPSGPTRAIIERHFALRAGHAEWERAVRDAGLPAQPDGWRPTPGERVVALWLQPFWYGATVTRVDRDTVLLRWDDNDIWGEPQRPLRELAPVATAPEHGADLSPGQFVLVRPPEPSQPWMPHKVARVAGNEVDVENAEGQVSRVGVAQLVPLVR